MLFAPTQSAKFLSLLHPSLRVVRNPSTSVEVASLDRFDVSKLECEPKDKQR